MQKNWYIAIVLNNTDRASAEKLSKEFEVFLPAQKVVSVWKDGRRKVRDKLVIPGRLLIHCTEQQRRRTLEYSFVKRYMVDSASELNEFGRHKVAIIPDSQVERLKYLLGQQEAAVEINNLDLRPGEKIRVIRGALCGLEGEVASYATTPKSQSAKIFIRIQHLGCATITVNSEDLERM